MKGYTRLALCFAVATTLITGCDKEISGHAVTAHPPLPPPPPEGRYASMLTKKERELLTYNAEIRAIDPCGYVNLESVAKLGIVKDFSAKNSQTDCELNVIVERDMNQSLEVKVGIIPKGSTYEKDSHTVTVGGKTVIENTDKWSGRPAHPGVNRCHDLLPFTDRSVLHVAVQRRTDDAACSETHTIVEGMIPRLVERPQRKDSTKQAYHAISVRDPCDLLVALGTGHSVTLSEILSPWNCYFTLDHDDAGGYYMVQPKWIPIASFANPSRSDERIDIAGNPALTRRIAKQCIIEVAVPDPPGRYDPIYDPRVATSAISASASTCEKAEAAAVAAVNAFLAT